MTNPEYVDLFAFAAAEESRIETMKDRPLAYRAHDYIVAHQGRPIPVKELCQQFFKRYTKALDTKMRNAVEQAVNDRMMQKIIISTHDGYLHPTQEQAHMIIKAIDALEKAAKALFYRRASIRYRIEHNEQYKLQIGKKDSPVYLAFEQEIIQEQEAQG